VDRFDNSAARAAVLATVRAAGAPCLHAGMSGDGYAEVVWDEHYTVPPDTGADACDYPLARNLVLLAVAVAAGRQVGRRRSAPVQGPGHRHASHYAPGRGRQGCQKLFGKFPVSGLPAGPRGAIIHSGTVPGARHAARRRAAKTSDRKGMACE
jgi:hypothetical protein